MQEGTQTGIQRHEWKTAANSPGDLGQMSLPLHTSVSHPPHAVPDSLKQPSYWEEGDGAVGTLRRRVSGRESGRTPWREPGPGWVGVGRRRTSRGFPGSSASRV